MRQPARAAVPVTRRLGGVVLHGGGQLAESYGTACVAFDLEAHRGLPLALAQALVSSAVWTEFRNAVVVVRIKPQPLLGVVGFFDDAERIRLDMLRQQLQHDLPRLRYISYIEAQQDCLCLAKALRERFGEALQNEFHYIAIPRGGHIVLGMLAYALDLRPERLGRPAAADAPLVVVDDCALSGTQFKSFLAGLSSRAVVFAHLYSPPELRGVIEERESRVTACVSARDLEDEAPRLQGKGYAAWLEHQRRTRGDAAYWFGQYPPFGFAWNEPDGGFWNQATNRREKAWNLLPPDLCLKHRAAAEPNTAQIVIQEEGPGPIVPAPTVLFADFDDAILVGETETESNYALREVGADMWRALVEFGDLERASARLRNQYAVDEATLKRDLQTFVQDLTARGLLEDRRGQGSPAGLG